MIDIIGTTIFGVFVIALLSLFVFGVIDFLKYCFKNIYSFMLAFSFCLASWSIGAIVISALRKL